MFPVSGSLDVTAGPSILCNLPSGVSQLSSLIMPVLKDLETLTKYRSSLKSLLTLYNIGLRPKLQIFVYFQ